MSGMKTVRLDTRKFDQMLNELRSYTGAEFKDIIKHEANGILSRAMEDTRAAKASLIDKRYTYSMTKFPDKRLIPFVWLNGVRENVLKIKKNGVWVEHSSVLIEDEGKKVWRKDMPNPKWKPMQAQLKKMKAYAKARRGLAKASWLYIAKKGRLGKLKKTRGYIVKALGLMTSGMKSKLGAKEIGKDKYVLEIRNFATLPMIRGGSRNGPGGMAAFKSAYFGRIKFFESNLARGVFKRASRIEKKYRGIKVTPLKLKV